MLPVALGCGNDSAFTSAEPEESVEISAPGDRWEPTVTVIYTDEYTDGTPGGVKDYSLIREPSGLYHIFHIADPWLGWQNGGEANLVHAVSSNLLSWTRRDRIELSHDSWSRTNIWAPHVYEEDGEYYMFYTGVEWGEEVDPEHPGSGYHWERIGMATPTDASLDSWEPLNDTGLVLDGPHQTDPRTSWSCYGVEGPWHHDCRDPFVIKVGDEYLMYVCVRLADYSAAIAIARATDLLLADWEWDDDYLHFTNLGNKAESPNIHKVGSYYYLFWTGSGSTVRVARSLEPDSGFTVLTDTQGMDLGYANEVLIQPTKKIFGAIGNGDGSQGAYELQLKKLEIIQNGSPIVYTREFKTGDWPKPPPYDPNLP